MKQDPDEKRVGVLLHLAVAVGFEPTVELPPHTLSRRAPLAARTRHRERPYRRRRPSKKSTRRAADSSARTPPTTSTLCVARGSRVRSQTAPPSQRRHT